MRLHRACPLTTDRTPFSIREYGSRGAPAVRLHAKKNTVIKARAARHGPDLLRERGQRGLKVRDTPGPFIVWVELRHECTV